MLITERHPGVLVATLSRPPVDALNDERVDWMGAALDQAIGGDAISVLHWRSDAKAFYGGADLALMRLCFATPEGQDPEAHRRVAAFLDQRAQPISSGAPALFMEKIA